MNKNAFTLIELLIVITIITILTSSGIIYFFRQVSTIKIASEIEEVINIVDKLDSEVDKKKILDYEIIIKKSDELGFIYSTNNLGLEYRQELDMDFETQTGILSTNQFSIGSNYNFKIYSDTKFINKNIIDATSNFAGNFGDSSYYKIVGNLDENILNKIFIYYYSPDNIVVDNENKLRLININSESDKTGFSYTSVEIKNLNGKKSIIGNTGGEIDKIYLFFEREGVEKYIEIKK